MFGGRVLKKLAVCLTVITAVEAATDIKSFFSDNLRYWPDKDTDGGCKAHNDDLTSSYQEAAKLIDSAVQAISYLKSTPRPSSIFRIKDRWNWDRQAHSMLSYFGIKISSKNGGPLPESKNNFDYVEMIFNQMQYGMQNDATKNPRGLPALYCGTKGWKYYKPEDNDPQDPTRKINEIMSGSGMPQWPRGLWYFNWNKIMNSEQTPDDNAFCGEGVIAFTLARLNVITFCDFAFSGSTVKSLDVGAAKELELLMSKGRNSLSLTWVHEFAHFYGSYPSGGLPDQPAVDKDGRPVTDKSGKRRKTYGVDLVFNLAKNNADAACRTADSYALFSMAMYFSQFDWSKGYSKAFSILW